MVEPTNTSAPLRLHFLDGIRGIACLYVLMFHEVSVAFVGSGALSGPLKYVVALLNQGHYGVVVFIVLSGFSLGLPIARSGRVSLGGGTAHFFRRRARRILPPYYVALALSILILAAYNVVGPRVGLGDRVEPEALSIGSILSHLFLVHNAWFSMAFRINGPMWSVATEWQIYIVFALALIPLWRRTNVQTVVVVAWIVGALPDLLVSDAHNFYWAGPWLLGSFALGLFGAVIGYGPSYARSWWRTRAPWSAFTGLSLAVVVTLVWTGRVAVWPAPVADFVVSVFAFCLINACWVAIQRSPEAPRSGLVPLFSARPLLRLGAFSYSLYLIQHPLLRLSEKAFVKMGLHRDATVAAHLVLVTPVIVGIAWIFAELFERPLTGGGVLIPAWRRRRTATAAVAAPIESTPVSSTV